MGNIDYYNNQWMSSEEVTYPSTDLGLQRGFGVFETMRAQGETIFQIDRHSARLRASAEAINLPFPWSDQELVEIWQTGLIKNGLSETSIKVIITGGTSTFLSQDSPPTLLVHFSPHHSYPDDLYKNGVTLRTSEFVRELPTVKSLNYLTSIIAWRAARAHGDHEALFISPTKQVRECATANVFFVQKGAVVTPGEGILLGTTRFLVCQLAREAGLQVLERDIPASELAEMDEAFITSTNRKILPVVGIDDLSVGTGQIGPITRQLMARFAAFETAYFQQDLRKLGTLQE
ncbi:MAG: aminotransferase class IV [Patescibacteria group bacterium]